MNDPVQTTAAPAGPPLETIAQVGPPPTSPGAEPVLEVPGYRLEGEIARGGMGVVYRAHDRALNRGVAVKVLGDRHIRNSLAAARFLEEAQITAQLQHPGIPPVHQVGTLPDGRPFLAMKLIRGKTLAALLADPTWDRGRVAPVFEQICQAVAFAHEHGVIHRDLKPQNVMVGAFGEVQVMDWGLARAKTRDLRHETREDGGSELVPRVSSDSSDLTVAGMALGTPAYMPPEQAIGALDKIDERSDVFGLGAILCHALTGQPPYAGGDAESTRRLAAQAKLTDADARLTACGADPELVALCRVCLSPDPKDRPANAGAVATAVAALRRAAEERARTAELNRVRGEAQHRRRRMQFLLVTAVSLLLAVGGVGGWYADHLAALRRAEQQHRDDEDHERRARNIDTLNELVSRCETALREGDAGRAAVVLDEVERRLPELGGEELTDRADRCRLDLAVLQELDAIDADRWTRDEGKRAGGASIADRWRAALAMAGAAPGSPGAVEVLRESPIRERLLGVLDLLLIGGRTPEVRELLRRADPDPFQDAVRNAVMDDDASRLATLADDPALREQPPEFAAALGQIKAIPVARRRQILGIGLHARPGDLTLLMNLGNTYPINRPDGAAERARYFQAAVAAHPQSAVAHLSLGIALRDLKDFVGSAAEFRTALRLAPGWSHAHNNLGNALGDLGDKRAAAAEFREAIRLDPDDPLPHNGLGNALADLGDKPGAVAELRKAVGLDPDAASPHSNLGLALEGVGDLKGAIAEFREAIRLNPSIALPHHNLANALADAGNLRGAVTEFREAIRLDPTWALPHNDLGKVLGGAGDFAGSAAEFREAIRLDPKDVTAHVNLGIARHHLKDAAGAVAAFREAMRLDPKSRPARNSLAWLLSTGPDDVRNGREALEQATKACELSGWQNPASLDTLAAAHAAAGQFDKAIELEEKALLDPEYAREEGDGARARLALYRRKKAFYDPTFAPADRKEKGPMPRVVGSE